MQIRTALHIGDFHTDYCEDFLISEPIGTDRQLLAVMDGCSSGTESAFASMLTGKTLRRIARDVDMLDFRGERAETLKALQINVLEQLFDKLRTFKNDLAMESIELLATLLLAVVDTKDRTAEIIVIGDGLVHCNGKAYEFDQNNRPDYIGYHLAEMFGVWYAKQSQRLTFENIEDLSLSSDGVFSFRPGKGDFHEMSESEILNHFFVDTTDWEREIFLDRKLVQMRDDFNLIHMDDVGMVRLRF